MALIRRNPPKTTFTIDCDEQEMQFLADGLRNGGFDCDTAEDEARGDALEKSILAALRPPATEAKKKR